MRHLLNIMRVASQRKILHPEEEEANPEEAQPEEDKALIHQECSYIFVLCLDAK